MKASIREARLGEEAEQARMESERLAKRRVMQAKAEAVRRKQQKHVLFAVPGGCWRRGGASLAGALCGCHRSASYRHRRMAVVSGPSPKAAAAPTHSLAAPLAAYCCREARSWRRDDHLLQPKQRRPARAQGDLDQVSGCPGSGTALLAGRLRGSSLL